MNREAFLLGYAEKIADETVTSVNNPWITKGREYYKQLNNSVFAPMKRLAEGQAQVQAMPNFKIFGVNLREEAQKKLDAAVAKGIQPVVNSLVASFTSPPSTASTVLSNALQPLGPFGAALGTVGNIASRVTNFKLPEGSPTSTPAATSGGFPWAALAIPAALYGGSLLFRDKKKKPAPAPVQPSGIPTFRRPGEPV